MADSAITRQSVIADDALMAPLILAENIEKAIKAAKDLIAVTQSSKGKILDVDSISKAKDEVSKLSLEQKQLETIQKQVATASARNNEAYIQQTKVLKEVRKELKEKTALGDRDAKTINKQNASIEELSAALTANRVAYARLTTEEQRNSKEGRALLSIIQQQDTEFKELRKSMGQHQDEVGNYSGAIKELKDELKLAKDQLTFVANTLGTSSKEYEEASARVSDISGKIGDMNDEIKAVSPGTPLEKLSARFSTLGDKVSNLDFKGAQAQIQGIVQVSRGVTFKEAISGAGGFTKSLFQLGKAILTNPLFLIAALVIGIGVAIYKLKDSLTPLRIAFDFIGDTIDWVVQKLKDFADWIGIATFADDEYTRKSIENAKKRRVNAEFTADLLIRLAEVQNRETLNLEIRKNRDIIKANRTTIAQLQKLGDKRTEDESKMLDELLEENVKLGLEIYVLEQTRLENAKKSTKERVKAEKDALFELQKFRLEQQIKEQERILADEDTLLTKRYAANVKATELRNALSDLVRKHELDQEGLNEIQKTLIREQGNARRLENDLKYLADKDMLNAIEIEQSAKALDTIANNEERLYEDRIAAARAAGDLRLQTEEEIAQKIIAIQNQILAEDTELRKGQASVRETLRSQELAALDQEYTAGLIKRREFETRRQQIQDQYKDISIVKQLKALEEEREQLEKFGRNTIEIDKAIAEARLAIAEENAEAKLEYERRFAESVRNLGNEMLATATTLMAANTENAIRNLEERLAKEEEASQRALAIVGNDAQAKAFIEQDFANKKKKIDEQIAAQKKKQFLFDRAIQAADIVAGTASGIVKAVAASPLTFGLPWSAFVGATGALQLARLFATPVPQFAEGVDNFKGGIAIVGEEGAELIKENGKFRLSANSASLEHLKPGASVIPHDETMGILAMAGLLNSNWSGGSQYNFKRIESKLGEVSDKITAAINGQPQDVWDDNGYRRFMRSEGTRVKRLDSRYSLR